MAGLGAAAIPLPFTDFHGGLNTRDNPYLVTFDQARELSNVQGTEAGSIVKRRGLVTLASPGNIFSSLFALESVSPTVLIGADSGAIYSVATDGTVTSLASGFSDDRWSFISAPAVGGIGPLYGMNGVDTPQAWTGSGSAVAWTDKSGSVAVPNGKYCVYNNNQAFVAGCTTTPSGLSGVTDPKSTVFWSAIADPTNWDPASLTGAGFEEFDPDDGDAITGIGVVGPYLLVGKPRKLWILVNPANAQKRQISSNIGIAAHRSIVAGNEGTYFLAEDFGVYLLSPAGTKLTPLPDTIRPTFDSITPASRQNACAAYIDRHYYVSVALNGSTNDTVLDYDVALQSWWLHAFGSNEFALWHSETGPAQLYSAKSTSAIIDQCFVPGVYSDNGSPMTWTWKSGWESPIQYRHRWWNTPYYRKRLRQLRLQGYGTVDLSLTTDFAGLETLIKSDTLATTSGGIFGANDGTIFGANDGSMFGAPSVQQAIIFINQYVADAYSVVFGGTSSTSDAVLSFILMLTPRRDLVFQG